jgi:hypothetical protein
MAQTIKLKRGLEINRTSITPAEGEVIYTKDNTEVYIGDGITPGGIELGYLNKRTGGTIANLTITGNLTVNGTTTTVNSNDVAIGDAIIFLNSDLENNGSPSEDSGLTVNRGAEPDASLIWDETNDYWKTVLSDGVTTTEARLLDTDDSFFKTIYGDSGSYESQAWDDDFTISGDSVITTYITGNELKIDHDFVQRNDTASEYDAIASTTFDVVDSIITSDEGHIVSINTKTVTIPSGYTGDTIPVSSGGTGITSVTENAILFGGTDHLQETSVGVWDLTHDVGQLLSVDSNGVPTWTNTIDGGTF